jgi:hypothetical protein
LFLELKSGCTSQDSLELAMDPKIFLPQVPYVGTTGVHHHSWFKKCCLCVCVCVCVCACVRAVVGIELRAWQAGILPRKLHAQAFLLSFVFHIRSYICAQAGLGLQSSHLHLLNSWDYRRVLTTLGSFVFCFLFFSTRS